MRFVVREKGQGRPRSIEFPLVVLAHDAWDDFGYRTTFAATLHLSSNESVELGSLKVLARRQESGVTPMPKGVFETLGDAYCLGDWQGNAVSTGLTKFWKHARSIVYIIYIGYTSRTFNSEALLKWPERLAVCAIVFVGFDFIIE